VKTHGPATARAKACGTIATLDDCLCEPHPAGDFALATKQQFSPEKPALPVGAFRPEDTEKDDGLKAGTKRGSRRVASFSGAVLALAAVLPALCAPEGAFAAKPRPDDDSLPMHFSIAAAGKDCPGCVVINASGEIVDDTARDFAAFLSRSRLDGVLPPEPETGTAAPADGPKVIVAFESVGGKVQSALIIGRRIRKAGWTTVIGQAYVSKGRTLFTDAGCYSACTMVMLGGVNRFIIPGSKVGIHQFSPQFSDGETFDAQEMSQIVRDYGREVVSVYDFVHAMGVNEDFFLATLRTPFNSLDVLPVSQWVSTGVATVALPDTDSDVPVTALLDAVSEPGRIAPPTTVIALAAPKPPFAPPFAPTRTPTGTWTVSRADGKPASAQFVSDDLRVSLACTDKKTARLDLSFKDLAPLDLERMRAAAFSAKTLKFADHRVSIDDIGLPAQGEQSLVAEVAIKDVEAIPTDETFLLAVLDKAGEPVGRSTRIPTAGIGKALTDAMSACGA